ncbi:GtrA family protein [Martelella alba]|uniref:GtrA family protein n=1 Tax=Martelella alba TaxID=2590451 RepID=A0A506U547_9HYPH|nr:GtrA family protein [Martelella alba]TPW28311.1 GtrA family protein [Martelella alba]
MPVLSVYEAVFLRFAVVGAIAFVVDWLCLSVLLRLGLPFFLSRAGSYLSAATTAWLLNRLWTFKSQHGALVAEWLKYLSANLVGGGVNYAVSVAMLYASIDMVGRYPVIAIAAGTICGMLFNFVLSKHYVFKA